MAYASDLVPRQKAAILMVLLGREYSSKVYNAFHKKRSSS